MGVWKYIRRRWKVFFRFVRYKVGDGPKVRFWHGFWCGSQLLKIFSQTCLVLHIIRMHGWQIICISEIVIFNGIYFLSDHCMIFLFFIFISNVI